MAYLHHLNDIEQGKEAWKQWRQQHPGVEPNLQDADLKGAFLSEVDLIGADLYFADLSETDLSNANLNGANLIGETHKGKAGKIRSERGGSWGCRSQ